MKKEIIIETRQNKIDYFLSKDAYHIPTDCDASNGFGGCAFELSIKDYFDSKSAMISKGGYADFKKKVDGIMSRFECKTGGGELCAVDEYGNTSGFACEYVIYAPTFSKGDYVGYAKVFTADEFIQALNDSKMIRRKRSSYMQKCYKKGLDWWYDRITVQSPKGRDSAVAKLLSYGITLDEFCERYGL